MEKSMPCPMGCGWECGELRAVDGSEVSEADNALSHMYSMSEHLREEHGALYPWEVGAPYCRICGTQDGAFHRTLGHTFEPEPESVGRELASIEDGE